MQGFEWLASLLPVSLSPVEALFLIALSATTSMMTATLGVGGGALLIAVMAQMLPVSALIPVHGLVQFGSNANRALLTRQYLDRPWVKLFLLGSLVGAAMATLVVVQLPLVIIQLSVGLFILWMMWGKKPKTAGLSKPGIVIAGGLTTFISMFVGATGPLVGGLLHHAGGDKMSKVATMAGALTVQHSLKIAVFTFVGFAFTEWLGFILLMIAAGAVGTWIGLKVLHRVSSALFNRLFRWTITLLALRLIYQAGVSLF